MCIDVILVLKVALSFSMVLALPLILYTPSSSRPDHNMEREGEREGERKRERERGRVRGRGRGGVRESRRERDVRHVYHI